MSNETLIWFAWWHDADLVVRLVFITLVVLSIGSWMVILYKGLLFRQLVRREHKIMQHVSKRWSRNDDLPTATSLEMVRQWNRQQRKTAKSDSDWRDLFTHQRLELENHLTLLATIGNSAPFIGLLGTVWGIMHALQKMTGENGISLEMVSGPVGEALAATAMGLFVAIPAVIGYNLLIRRLRTLQTLIETNARRLLHARDLPALTEAVA